MKAILKEMIGPNKAACEIAGKSATVRIPVNIQRPPIGEVFEVKETWIVPISKPEAKVVKPKPEAKAVPVTESGIVIGAGEPAHSGEPRKK